MTKVTGVMSKYLVRLPCGMTAEDALERLEREAVHHALVAPEGDMQGVVCRCDLERVPARTHVGDCMKKDYVFVDEATTAREAAEMMQRWGIGFLPVIGPHGALVGVVTRRDLRRTGHLPNRRGVDRCASCGETHSLAPCTDDWIPVFCRNCSEPPTTADGRYLTLGGGD
jgi:CBS-domain-containing membrane protein